MSVHSFEGSTLEVSTDGGGAWTDVNGVTTAEVPGPSRAEIDVTDSKSTAKEFITDIPDNGTWTFNLNRDDEDAGQQICLNNAYGAGAIINWRITFPSGKTMEAKGYVSAFPDSGGNGQVYTTSMGVRISGAVTGTAISE